MTNKQPTLTTIPPLSRAAMLQRLQAVDEIQVLIVGGGINGVGVFRELCLQGVRCLIVDREDFGAGASSASSRMAHGGLRYLENGEFGLVSESTHERNRLLRNAAHGVVPLPVAVPFFSFAAGTLGLLRKALRIKTSLRTRGLLVVALGLRLYDWLGRHDKALPNHRLSLRTGAMKRFPFLHPAVVALASYHDAKILYPERIAMELVLDGLASQAGSVAVNHCALEGREGGTVLLRDGVSGLSLRVRPQVLINAGGAWIDRVNEAMQQPSALIGGTKGSHLVLDCPALHAALNENAFLWDDGAGRMCIVYPHQGKVILGATDIRIEDADQAVCEDSEQHYLLGAIRVIFPTVAVDASQVCYRFCGVRPLPRSASAKTVDISRDHANVQLPPQGDRPFPVHSLVGGKWTTFRAFSEQVADAVLGQLQVPRVADTRDLPIGGGKDFPREHDARARWLQQACAEFELSPPRMAVLLERYGSRARQVAAYCRAAADAPLRSLPDYSEREILHLLRHEMAAELEDLVYRRSTLALMGRVNDAVLKELAALMAAELGWNEQQAAARLLRVRERLERSNGVRLAAEAAP